MGDQHYVPKFYFRQFNGEKRYIHVLLMKDGRVVLNASVKHQCCDGKLYASDQIESHISQLETEHSVVMKRAIDMAWSGSAKPLTAKEHAWLLQAILFQNARTMLEARKMVPSMERIAIEMFAHYVSHKDPAFHARLVKEIARGKVRVIANPSATVMQSIIAALQSTVFICDLGLHLVRNLTDYPFIFSDSPVVLYNTYYRNVTSRGVLGLQTPGLQIFLPLNSRTLLMLVDENIYRGQFTKAHVFDVTERYDVSQLNALQLHHSLHTVYFGDPGAREYVEDLWRTHKPMIVQPRSCFVQREGWLVDGKPVDGELFQMYQPQLNFKLDLSFIDSVPVREEDFRFRRRTPDLPENRTPPEFPW